MDIETVKKLMRNHKNLLDKHAFIHSNKGVHYTSPRFQKLFIKNIKLANLCLGEEIVVITSRKESFFDHMKDDIYLKSCITFAELEASIDYYNNYRYQWMLKKLDPVQYRNQLIPA